MMKEVINDLFDYPNLKIVQNPLYFKFSLDTILLFEFLKLNKNDKKILDMCAGNAPIAMLIASQYKKQVVGFEIQQEIYSLGCASIALNHLENSIEYIKDDVRNLKNYFPGNNFDAIVCNPPYFALKDQTLKNENEIKAKARHEICITLQEIIFLASENLKEKHSFYLVHIPERLDEIIIYCNQYKIPVKEIQFIYTNRDKGPTLVLFRCLKNGSKGVRIGKPIFIDEYKSYQNIFE